MNKSNSSRINDLDMNVGLDIALSTRPSVPVKFAFESKSTHVFAKKTIFNAKEVAEVIQYLLKEYGGHVYRENIVLTLKDDGLNDSQIDQVFGYGINNGLFSVSSNNRIVKLIGWLDIAKHSSSDSTAKVEESKVISFSDYQKSLLVEEKSINKSAKEKLTYKQRKTLPTEVFAWPEKRKYPIHDASHARNAMARLSAALKKGHVTKSQYNKIRSRILSAYLKFGIKPRKQPLKVVKGKKEILPPMKMAAEHCF